MAENTNIINISKQLSYSLNDPVSVGSTDGLLYSAAFRLQLINNSIKYLVQLLETIHYDITQVFKDYYVVKELATPFIPATETITLEDEYDYDEIYYANLHDFDAETTTPKRRAIKINAKEYYELIVGNNSMRDSEPSASAGSPTNLYWTIIDNELKLFPTTYSTSSDYIYYYLTAIVKDSLGDYTYENDPTSIDLSIPKDYVGLLLLIALREAHRDSGDVYKYNLATGSINERVRNINQIKAEHYRKDIKGEPI